MFKFLFRKETRLEASIFDYLEAVKMSQHHFAKALDICFQAGEENESFDFHLNQTHKYESKADDIRDEVNNMMYGKALIPDSRGDVMMLLDQIDKIPHLFEAVLYMLQTQKIVLPGFLVADIKELVRLSLECADLTIRQATALLKKTGGIRTLLTTIDANESHCDHFQRRLISRVFDSDMDAFFKLQLKELVTEIGKISDQAERISNRINIVSLKRRV